MNPKSSLLLFGFIFCLLNLTNSEPPPEWHDGNGGGGGGGLFPKIRNSGPSKIFEWLGSRISKFPSLLPKLPSFPKYQVPHKLPNYHIVIPDPPSNAPQSGDFYSGHISHEQVNHGEAPYQQQQDGGDGVNFESGPQNQQQEYTNEEQYNNQPQENQHYNINNDNNNIGHQNDQPPPQNNNYNQNQYNTVSQNEIPANEVIPPFKSDESPIEVVPSTMLAYNKETYPPADQGAGWQDGYAGIQNNPPQPIPGPSPILPLVSGSYYTKPEVKKQVMQQVPITPHSTGPDYFNTAYGHQGTQTQDFYAAPLTGNYAPPPEYDNFGAAFSSVQQQSTHAPNYNPPRSSYESTGKQVYNQANNGFDFNHQDFGTLISTLDQGGFESSGSYNKQNRYPPSPSSGFVPPVQEFKRPQNKHQGHYTQSQPIPLPSQATLRYEQPPVIQPTAGSSGNGYINHSPGVKIIQSQDSGNPVFEIIADANAPDYNGHPFDINKLISMIEPGAQLVDTQLSQDTSAGSEKRDVQNSYEKSNDGTSSTGSPDLQYLSNNTVNLVDLPLTNQQPQIISNQLTLDENSDRNSSSLKDIMNFFQLTDGKGYVVVEKKGPKGTTDLTDLPNDIPTTSSDRLTFELDNTGHDTRLNITASNFPFLFPTATNPPPIPNETTTNPPVVFFAVRTTTRHPNHNYNNRKFPQIIRSRPNQDQSSPDLEFAETNNIKSIAITVTPPPSTLKPLRSNQLNPSMRSPTKVQPSTLTTVTGMIGTVTKKSMTSSISSKTQPGRSPVYKKSKSIPITIEN